MKRIDIPTSPPGPHFIGSWFIEPKSLCDDLVNFFETHPDNQTEGKTAGGLNVESKQSTDLAIRPRDLEQADHKPVREYLDALFDCHKDYLEQWPFLKDIMGRAEFGTFNIQRYHLGGHFLKTHAERTTISTSHRVLAWMTYLNDVEDGGSTYFVHHDLDVQPQKGKTMIWPAEWTHAHFANVVNSGKKYIATGWMNFPLERS
ncbi:MAG: 2OG-Fe(II) oxygenase [Gammaproteobacteria bacterium]|jgi:hypothetical protein|nr:2OG-Fe(II) oxygenase [Gammaproteobacteria bacterium]MDP6096937.1 2OG-Fe(II) oxygenase [Gammaproteobacteria bacterium]MDP7455691.1 2OG-Fe(II) oxygenase [Gammaproteobacteria bacterium]|tara:strand:- start:5388 stop:5996 length:609 start_codon:yes stop_codon:yes gene_type:complete